MPPKVWTKNFWGQYIKIKQPSFDVTGLNDAHLYISGRGEMNMYP